MSAAFDFLRAQSDDFFDRLYGAGYGDGDGGGGGGGGAGNPTWACRSVFQSLSAVSKTYVLRLMFLGDGQQYTADDCHSWLVQESEDINVSSLRELLSVRILRRDAGRFSMNKHFQTNFKQSLTSQLTPWSESLKIEDFKSILASAPSVADIETRCSRKWNAILRYLVTTDDSATGVHESAKRFLLSSGLVSTGIDEVGCQRLLITVTGYEYMLKDQSTQVWAFVLDYIRRSERPEEVLSLMFQLSFCEVGRGYPFNGLTDAQKVIVADLYNIGIVHRAGNTSCALFFPSFVAVNMIFRQIGVGPRANSLVEELSSDLQIIVETNFQVCAYVQSELHLDMLKLFVEVSIRMPNMAFGYITRAKAKCAFHMGIKAAQVIDFLTSHSHQTVQGLANVIPPNVREQLLLWEAELDRFTAVDVSILDFSDIVGDSRFDTVFSSVYSYASQLDAHAWSNRDKRMIAVLPDSYEKVFTFTQSVLSGKML